MKALVTGSQGFVGRHVVPLLRDLGYAVAEIDIKHPTNAIKAETFYEQEHRHGFTKWDVIIHLAANIEDVDARMRGGVEMFQDITLDYATAKYIEKNPPSKAVVWMTSCAVDSEDDPYAWVKRTGEKYCAALVKKGVPVKILRPYSGYGTDQALSYPFPAIMERAKRRENPLTVWGSGKQVRDFVHIDDLAAAVVHAIDYFPIGEPVEIGTEVGTDFIHLAKLMAEEVGYSPVIHCDESKSGSSNWRVARSQNRYGWYPKVTLKEGIARSCGH